MSYWMIACRTRGTEEWNAYEPSFWTSRVEVTREIEALQRQRAHIACTGRPLADLEFAPAQVRVEAE